MMAAQGAAEEILERYCIASGAILIFAPSAKERDNCLMERNMPVALGVVRK
jgi:hypothetical protein